jgi:hypothetical protein
LKKGGVKLPRVKKERAVKAQPTVPSPLEQKAKKRISRRIPKSSTGSHTHSESLSGGDGENRKLGSIGQKINFRKFGNNDFLKFFDDQDENGYWEDEED